MRRGWCAWAASALRHCLSCAPTGTSERDADARSVRFALWFSRRGDAPPPGRLAPRPRHHRITCCRHDRAGTRLDLQGAPPWQADRGMPRWRGSPLPAAAHQAVSKRGSRIKSRSPMPRGLRESLTPWTSAWQHLPAARLQHDTCGNNSMPGPLAFIALQHHSGFSGLSCTPNMDAADDLPSFTNTSRQNSAKLPHRETGSRTKIAPLCRCRSRHYRGTGRFGPCEPSLRE